MQLRRVKQLVRLLDLMALSLLSEVLLKAVTGLAERLSGTECVTEITWKQTIPL